MRMSLAFMGCSLLALAARADDELEGTRGKMVETGHEVRIVVDRGHARMVVRRSVRAEGDRHDQAVYQLRLPEGAAAVGLRTLGARDGRPVWYAGELMEAESAAAKYKELTGVGGFYPKDPALLSWREQGHLALQVFPVAPRTEKTVEYTLVLPTRYENGRDVLTVEPRGLPERPPRLTIEAARPDDRVWVNGQPYPSGATMPWPGSQEDGAHGCTGAVSELRIELARGNVGKLSGSLASVPLGEHGGLVHLRLEAARHLSRSPSHASLVVLVDKSYSVAEKDRDAGLAAVRQVLRRLPDARVAVLPFDRKVTPLFPGFRAAPAASDALADAEFVAGNGSAVDEALAAADRLLAGERPGRERRIYLLSDLLTRSRLAVASLAPLTRRAVLHVGTLSEGDPALEPEPQGAWTKLARSTGGLCWKGQARAEGIDASTMTAVYEEWVRPTRLHALAVEGLAAVQRASDRDDSDFAPSNATLPAELREGDAFDYLGLPFEKPRQVSVRAELWSRPVRTVLASTPQSERLSSALIFGDALQAELSPREMMTLAMRGRAVSPVTSYLAIEPGVRPSTEGLEEMGTGGGGTGEGTLGLATIGTIGKGGGWDPQKLLRVLLAQAREVCKLGDKKVSATIQTTYHEIVDVPRVIVAGDGDAGCILEAIWSWALPGEFSDERADYELEL